MTILQSPRRPARGDFTALRNTHYAARATIPILPRKSYPAGTKNEFTIAYIEKGRIIRKIFLDGKTAILI